MIRYRRLRGYKYELAADYAISLATPADLAMTFESASKLLRIDASGSALMLTIRAGYAWDGPSGPAIDTRNFLRASLVHDALYQLMRANVLDREAWRPVADETLYKLCREDGMSALRAGWVRWAVRSFAARATENGTPEEQEIVLEAP